VSKLRKQIARVTTTSDYDNVSQVTAGLVVVVNTFDWDMVRGGQFAGAPCVSVCQRLSFFAGRDKKAVAFRVVTLHYSLIVYGVGVLLGE